MLGTIWHISRGKWKTEEAREQNNTEEKAIIEHVRKMRTRGSNPPPWAKRANSHMVKFKASVAISRKMRKSQTDVAKEMKCHQFTIDTYVKETEERREAQRNYEDKEDMYMQIWLVIGVKELRDTLGVAKKMRYGARIGGKSPKWSI